MSQELTLFDMGVKDTTQPEEQKKKESIKQYVVKSAPAPKKKEEPLLVNAE